ncbi:MAG: hypothetical protein ABSH41_23885 [Syntrophobacteraceae bacterium]
MKRLKTKGKFMFYPGKCRRVPLPLEKGTRLIRYCLKLIAAAKEVVGNWDQGDLAAAVRNLDATLKEIEAKIGAKRRQMIVLIIEYRSGRNVYVCESENVAIAQLHRFVEEYWNEMPESLGKIPANRQEAIKAYFEKQCGNESYEMLTLPVLPATTL